MRKLNIVMIFITVCLSGVFLLTGCGNTQSVVEKQQMLRDKAMKAMSDGKYAEAVEVFDQTLKGSDGKIGELEMDVCYQKAFCQMKTGLEKEALETLSALLKYNEKDSKAYYLKGSIYMAANEKEKGIRNFDQAIEYDAAKYSLYISIYEQLMCAGLEENAKDYLKKATTIEGDSSEDYRERGRIYLLLKNYEEAKKQLDKALNEKDEDAKLYMAKLLEETGNTQQAYTVYESYAQNNKKDGNAQYKLGLILMETKDYKGALEYFQKALKSGSIEEETVIQKNQMICYEKMQDYKSALQIAKSYVAKYPEDLEMKKEFLFLSTRVSEE